jgi:hypothetical protein
MSSGYRHYENTQRLSVASETAAAMARDDHSRPPIENADGVDLLDDQRVPYDIGYRSVRPV